MAQTMMKTRKISLTSFLSAVFPLQMRNTNHLYARLTFLAPPSLEWNVHALKQVSTWWQSLAKNLRTSFAQQIKRPMTLLLNLVCINFSAHALKRPNTSDRLPTLSLHVAKNMVKLQKKATGLTLESLLTKSTAMQPSTGHPLKSSTPEPTRTRKNSWFES